MIIENDDEIRTIVTYVLESEGYEVQGAGYSDNILTGIQADLILLDEWVNNKQGHMLCKDIKALEELKAVPVIIFSTATDIADIAKSCSADGFIQKPFDIDTLTSEVKKFLPLRPVTQTV